MNLYWLIHNINISKEISTAGFTENTQTYDVNINSRITLIFYG